MSVSAIGRLSEEVMMMKVPSQQISKEHIEQRPILQAVNLLSRSPLVAKAAIIGIKKETFSTLASSKEKPHHLNGTNF